MSAAVLTLLVMAGGGVVLLSHRLGRRAGMRQTIPWRPIFQLVEHRTRCLAHHHVRVQLELGPALGIPPWAWDELFALRRPLTRRRPAPAGTEP